MAGGASAAARKTVCHAAHSQPHTPAAIRLRIAEPSSSATAALFATARRV